MPSDVAVHHVSFRFSPISSLYPSPFSKCLLTVFILRLVYAVVDIAKKVRFFPFVGVFLRFNCASP